MTKYKDVRPYDPASFNGSASSYAGQGLCSLCSGSRPADYQARRGAALVAICSVCLSQRDYFNYLRMLELEGKP